MKRFFMSALLCGFLILGVFAEDDLPGHHLPVLISDTWGARFRGDSPAEALWSINDGYDFGISMDDMLLQNGKIRYMGKLQIERRDSGIGMLRQSSLIYLSDGTPVTYTVTYFVDETSHSPGAPPRGYFAVRLEVRSANLAYMETKFNLLVNEVDREFTAPINPVPGRNGSYYQWGGTPPIWRQWPLELYYQEPVQQETQITYFLFSQLGQNQGERNQRFPVQTLYNWVIKSR